MDQTPNLQLNEKSEEVEQLGEDIRDIPLQHNNDNKIEIPLKNLLGRDVKKYNPENLYTKILLNICNNDTSEINYNKYGVKGYKMEPISEIFSDNIIIAGLVPIEELPEQIEDDTITTSKDDNNRFIKFYRNVIYNFLLKNNITNVLPKDIKLKGIRSADGKIGHIPKPNKSLIEEFYNKFKIECNKEEKEIKAQHFKIALANVNYDTILKLFCKENIKELEENYIFVSDIDYTQDFKGSFNKKEIIDHLLTNSNFKLEGDNLNNREYKDHTIINNNKTVGRNCLTFFYNNCRYKFYNKFVHSLEVKSNTKRIGNNILEWVNNPEERLKDTISKCLENGITRLEITFYVSDKDLPEKEEINKSISYLYNLMPENLTYNTPIKEQWRAFTEVIKTNYLMLDIGKKNAVLCYSVNKLTSRVSGVYIDNYDIGDIRYILSKCLFNLPLTILFVGHNIKQEIEIKNKIVKCTQEEIIKYGKLQYKITVEEPKDVKYLEISYANYFLSNKKGTIRDAYLISPNNIYNSITSFYKRFKKVNTPEEMGIIPINNIAFTIPEKNHASLYKAKNKDNCETLYIKCNTEIDLIFLPPKELAELYNKREFEEKNNIEEVLNKNVEIYNNFAEKQNKILEEETKDNNVVELFNTCKKLRLHDLHDGESIIINAIKTIKTKYGDCYICLDRGNEKLYYSNNALKSYIDKILTSLFYNKKGIYHINNYENILNVTKIGTYKYEGTECVKLNIISNKNLNKIVNKQTIDKKDLAIEMENLKLEYLDNATKEKECEKLDDLEEGQELTIIGCVKKLNGSKEKYLIKFKEIEDKIYISNSFFEEKITETGMLECKTKIKMGIIKLDKSKKKHRLVYF